MPKGVEHNHNAFALSEALHVIFPLMPKGVEHFLVFARSSAPIGVIFPLMPKGVEHSNVRFKNTSIACDFPSDAERR